MLKIVRAPESERANLGITLNARPADAYRARVSKFPYNTPWPGRQRPIDQTEDAYFMSFESDEPVEIRIALSAKRCIVRPLSKNIRARCDANAISFTIPAPGQYAVEPEGMPAIHIFANPPADFGFAPDDANVKYYAPGVHHIGVVRLKSHERAYIDSGAVVYGAFIAAGAEDVAIAGYGVLDGSWENRSGADRLLPLDYDAPLPADAETLLELCQEKRVLYGNIRFYRCRNVSVRGVIARDAATFSLIPAGCENVLVDNFKTIGMWRYNSDGVDVFNSSNVLIQNSFFRNFDDCIVVKGVAGWDDRDNENILVKNCVVWCDWGRALELGAETNAPKYRNIAFENCDLIHGCAVYMDIQHHNRADIADVRFENIRCEYQKDHLPEKYQSDLRTDYAAAPASTPQPILMGCFIYNMGLFAAKEKYENGNIRDITFRNIQILTDPGMEMPVSAFHGLDKAHTVSNVRIENVTLNGKPVKTLNASVNAFTENIFWDGEKL